MMTEWIVVLISEEGQEFEYRTHAKDCAEAERISMEYMDNYKDYMSYGYKVKNCTQIKGTR